MTGHSHYINGSDGLDHLHRLRALVDAVVIGVGTAVADDPLLDGAAGRAARIPSASSSIPMAGCRPARRALRDDGVRASHHHPARRFALRRASKHIALPRRERPGRAARHPREPRRARPAAHPDRGRLRNDFAVSRGALPRPASRRGGADHPRRRPLGSRADADRAMRGGAAAAHPHPPARQRGAVRLRPLGISACRSAPRRNRGDRPASRAARRDVVAALGEPVVEQAGRDAHFRRGAGPAGQHLRWMSSSRRSEHPVGAALRDCKAFRLQAIATATAPPAGPSAGPKPLSVSW